MSPASNIVVFLRSRAFFGSQIIAYPLLYQLRQWWPHSAIRVVAKDDLASYYTCLPWVDEFIFSSSRWNNYKLLNGQTHTVISLHDSSELYGSISWFKRIPVRIGFRNRRISDFNWTHSWEKGIDEYIGLSNLNLLRTYKDFDPQAAAQASILALSRTTKAPSPPRADVILMPGGGAGAFKRWPLENYLRLADLLKAELGPETTFGVVLGSAEQAEHAFLQQLGRPDIHLLASRPIADIAAAVSSARLVVANDCGPSHIAQNAVVPYVGIFAEPNPEWLWTRRDVRGVVPDTGCTDINTIRPEQVLTNCMQVVARAECQSL